MKGWRMGLVAGLLLCGICRPAEAGVGKWLTNSILYLYEPVPAIWNFGTGIVACLVEKSVTLVKEVVGNINANPGTLAPIVPPPFPQPVTH